MTPRRRPAARFADLHRDPPPEPTPGILVMPNPWDVGSAKVLTTLGFCALATTSAGFAGSLGRHDQHIRREELIDHVSRSTVRGRRAVQRRRGGLFRR